MKVSDKFDGLIDELPSEGVELKQLNERLGEGTLARQIAHCNPAHIQECDYT